jgi:hypothetical protein
VKNYSPSITQNIEQKILDTRDARICQVKLEGRQETVEDNL